MDFAYDQIQGETVIDRADTPKPLATAADTDSPATETKSDLNTEFQETFRAFSNSPWGAKLGGLWGNVRKQGETVYAEARKEAEELSGEAIKGFTDLKTTLVSRTRGMSQGEQDKPDAINSAAEKSQNEADQQTDDLISRFKTEAAKRLKDIEKAEDAADEALLRFGTNIRNFLRDAVSVAPPSDDASKQPGGVFFESKDASGKRIIHTTRFDAQLHVIHSSLDSFMHDPVSGEWPKFKADFKIDSKTDVVSKDLEKYSELRKAMEDLVPEKVDYSDFWCRYYFLRHVIETEEEKRREILRGASSGGRDEEEVGWGEDSDEETPSTPQAKRSNGSSTTIHQIPPESQSLKPEGRKSDDRTSRPDSDASYDLVSGASSRAPGSPKDEKPQTKKDEESDEEDWE